MANDHTYRYRQKELNHQIITMTRPGTNLQILFDEDCASSNCSSTKKFHSESQPKIPGCDGVPYVDPNSPLSAGVWFWSVDVGVPDGDTPIYEFQWGNFEKLDLLSKKEVIANVFADLTKNNSKELKQQINTRIDSIIDFNNSAFQKNAAGR